MALTYFTPISVGASDNVSTWNNPLGQLDAAIAAFANGDNQYTQLRFGTPTLRTIASGEISITGTSHGLETEGGTNSDDLDTINGGQTGDLLLLQQNSAHQIVVKHNTGNIWLAGGADVILDDGFKVLPLRYDGTKWVEVGAGYWTKFLNLGQDTTLNIASDAVTVTRSRHTVDTEGGASTDNLSTINGGIEGITILLNSANSARVITMKHGTGNIQTRSGRDIILDDPLRTVVLYFTGVNWVEVNATEFGMKTIDSASYSDTRNLVLPSRTLLSFSGQNNRRLAVQPSPEVADSWSIRANGTGVVSVGVASGTVTSSSTLDANQTEGRFTSIATTASIGNSAHIRSPFGVIRGEWNPTFYCRIKLDTTKNNRRMWIGLFNGTTPGNVDTLTVQGLGFRFSDAIDINWMAVAYNGSVQGVVNTQVQPVVSNVYLFKIRCDYTNNIVYFSINNSTEVSISSNLPLGSLEYGGVVEVTTTTASSKLLYFNRMAVEHI